MHVYLRLLLLCGVNNGGAAHFGDLAPLAVKGPTTDLISDHIFDEEDAAVEPQGQFVKQLNVFQHIVVRVAVEDNKNYEDIIE